MLAGVTFLTFLLAVTGVIGWPLQLVVDLILVAFVVHLRTQAKRAAAVARQRRRAAVAPAPASPAHAPTARRQLPAPGFEERGTEPMQPVEAPVAEQPRAAGRHRHGRPLGAGPGAPADLHDEAQGAAALDLRAAGPAAARAAAWTSRQRSAEPQPEVQREVRVEAAAEVSELDGILEHRWAVND